MNVLDMTDPQIVALAMLLGAQLRRDGQGFWFVTNLPEGQSGPRNYIGRAAMDYLVAYGCLTAKEAEPYYARTWFGPFDNYQKHEQFLKLAEKEYNNGDIPSYGV